MDLMMKKSLQYALLVFSLIVLTSASAAMVYAGEIPHLSGTSMRDLHYDSGSHRIAGNQSGTQRVRAEDSVTMGGNVYNDAITFHVSSLSHGLSSTWEQFSLHNLNGQYRWLTGHIGRVDGTSALVNATFNFYADGKLIETHLLDAQALPTPINLFVEDVRQIIIEVVQTHPGGSGSARYVTYAFAGFAEDYVPLPPPTLSTGTPMRALHYDSGTQRASGNLTASPQRVRAEDTVIMGGNVYHDAITFHVAAPSAGQSTTWRQFSLHNLNGQYKRLTGYIGRVDGTSALIDATVNIYANGNIIETFNLDARGLPKPIDLNVEDVRQIIIQVFTTHGGNSVPARTITYAFVGFAEEQVPISPPTPVTGTSMSDTFFNGGSQRIAGNQNATHNVQTEDTVLMGANVYKDAIAFRVHAPNNSGLPTTWEQFSLHNLNGQYKWLTGYIGRVDRTSALIDATVNIYADGSLIETRHLDARFLPERIHLPVEHVNLVRIAVTQQHPGWNMQGPSAGHSVTYAFVGHVHGDMTSWLPDITTSAALPLGIVNTPYSIRLAAAGAAPITWSLQAGSALPDGLVINSTGLISGTPSQAGSFNFTIEASNILGSVERTFSLEIASESLTSISANPLAPDFGIHVFSPAQHLPQTITITNTGNQSVAMDALPTIEHWLLVEGENWNVPISPGQTRTFTIQPDNRPRLDNGNPRLVAGIYHPTITVTGSGGVSVEIQPMIEITILWGNVTGSGVLGLADLMRLNQYLAGHPVEIDREAADIAPPFGTIGLADLMRLNQYLAGHLVTLGPLQGLIIVPFIINDDPVTEDEVTEIDEMDEAVAITPDGEQIESPVNIVPEPEPEPELELELEEDPAPEDIEYPEEPEIDQLSEIKEVSDDEEDNQK